MKALLMMGLALALATPAVAGEQERKPGDETLQDAMDCMSYLPVVQHAFPKIDMGKMLRYWATRRDDLAKSAQLTPADIELQQLLIPITPERVPVVLASCGAMMPKR